MKCPYCGYDINHTIVKLDGYNYIKGDVLGCLFKNENTIVRLVSNDKKYSIMQKIQMFDFNDKVLVKPKIYTTNSYSLIYWELKGIFIKDRLKNNISKVLIWDWFRTIIKILSALHSKGRSHGFINEYSIIIGNNDEIYLIDYGLNDASPWEDMINISSVFMNISNRLEGYEIESLKKLLLDMYEGKYSSAIELNNLIMLTISLEDFKYGESIIKKSIYYLKKNKTIIILILIASSFFVSWLYNKKEKIVIDSFYVFHKVILKEKLKIDKHKSDVTIDFSFDFNRLPAGGDVYIYIPKDIYNVIPKLNYFKLLGLQSKNYKEQKTIVLRFSSWNNTHTFTGKGGNLLDTAGLLLDAGYDPSSPNPNCLYFYMKLPSGSPPKYTIWTSLFGGVIPASVALRFCQKKGMAVFLFSNISLDLVDSVNSVLASIDGLVYSVSVVKERLVITFEL